MKTQINRQTRFSSIEEAREYGWLTPKQFLYGYKNRIYNKHYTIFVFDSSGGNSYGYHYGICCALIDPSDGQIFYDPILRDCPIWKIDDVSESVTIDNPKENGKSWPVRFIPCIHKDDLGEWFVYAKEWGESAIKRYNLDQSA